MYKSRIIWSLFTIFTLNCFADAPMEIMLRGKKIYWQDPEKQNRYHMDLNGDGLMDGLDVLLDDGMDAYSEHDAKLGFGKKLKMRYEKNSVIEEYQKRDGSGWLTYRTRQITKVNENEADYRVWNGDRLGKDVKLAFEERLDSSSLQSEEIATCTEPDAPKEQLDFSGLQAILSKFNSMFDFDQSCYDLCGKMVEHFKLEQKNDKIDCKFLFESLAAQSVENTFSCLVDNPALKSVGPGIAHRILTGLRPTLDQYNQKVGHIKVSCVENQEYLARVFGFLPQDNKHIVLDISDFMGPAEQGIESLFTKAMGHEIYHLGNYYHSHNEVDVSYACNECCSSKDALACQVCSRADVAEMQDEDYLAAALIFKKYIGPQKPFRPYHKALEKLHAAIQNDAFFNDFEKKIPMPKGELVEELYQQLTTHLRNPVDDRGEGKLRYSDMLAEVMAKITCSDIGRLPSDTRTLQDRYGCEVMYLARSVPASYCYKRKSKQSCIQAIRLRYSRRKKMDQTGIPIPENFLSLDRSYD